MPKKVKRENKQQAKGLLETLVFIRLAKVMTLRNMKEREYWGLSFYDLNENEYYLQGRQNECSIPKWLYVHLE